MFTGIIETIGIVTKIEDEEQVRHLTIQSAISTHLKPEQSVSHDGVCLTVTNCGDSYHCVTAVSETLEKSTLLRTTLGDKINVERAMLNNGRFDGHIVQGHVDQTATCVALKKDGASLFMEFSYSPMAHCPLVEKGSITINGISLTCFNVRDNVFTVVVIPYTLKHTNLVDIKAKDNVNIEFDILGKYVARLQEKNAC